MLDKLVIQVNGRIPYFHPDQIAKLPYWVEFYICSVDKLKDKNNGNYFVIGLFAPEHKRILKQRFFEFSGKSKKHKVKCINNFLTICQVNSVDNLVGARLFMHLANEQVDKRTFVRGVMFKAQALGSTSRSSNNDR